MAASSPSTRRRPADAGRHDGGARCRACCGPRKSARWWRRIPTSSNWPLWRRMPPASPPRGKRIVYQSHREFQHPLGDDITLLRIFYKLGVRMAGPIHFKNNQFGDSATDKPQWNGLSPMGREFVALANDLGMVLDASHASDDVFDQMMELSRAPIICRIPAAARCTTIPAISTMPASRSWRPRAAPSRSIPTTPIWSTCRPIPSATRRGRAIARQDERHMAAMTPARGGGRSARAARRHARRSNTHIPSPAPLSTCI